MADEGILLTGEDSIKELELEEVVNSEDVITMGSACSSKLTMKLIDAPAGIDYDRRKPGLSWKTVRWNIYRWEFFMSAR